MPDNPNAEIIAIGTELLLGEITDTNSVYMARQLRDIGVNVFFMTTVGDNLGRIAASIRGALERAEVVITCGGLGPTVDDMTRQAVADATGRQLEFHQSLYDSIAERFRGFGVPMTDNNRQQAWLPAGATLIENPVGTAPAFVVETERGSVISLPGVPREMKYLFVESVVPHLLRKYELGVIVARTLRTAGIGESSLDDIIGADILQTSNPSVGLAAHHGCVDVRVTAKARGKAEAEALLDAMQARLNERIGEHVFGIDDDTLESVVADLLRDHGFRAHIAEAGLPGVISDGLPADADLVATAEIAEPEAILGINDANALRERTIELARGNRQESGVDVAVVALSDPNLDENADVEGGSVVAIVTANFSACRVYGFGARSSLAREWLSRWGLANLWRMLKAEAELAS